MNIAITTGEPTAKPDSNATIMAGGGLPLTVTFDVAPGAGTLVEIEMNSQATPALPLAYLGVWAQQSDVVFTGLLDTNDTRLAAALVGFATLPVNCAVRWTPLGGIPIPCPNFTLTVQPSGFPTPAASEGGPVYLTAASIGGILTPYGFATTAMLSKAMAVENAAARYALTTAQVTLLSWIIQENTGDVFGVLDLANLGNDSGYCHLGYITPSNSVPPALSTGAPSVSSVISCGAGNWNGSPMGFGYQWQASLDGIIWTNIAGQTSPAYTPVAGDQGNFLRCGVVATNSNGTSVPVYAAAATPVAGTSLLSGLIAYYTLDEESGVRADSTGGFNLSDSGGTGSAPGIIGNAANFTGGTYLSTAISPAITGLSGATLSAWVKFSAIESGIIVAVIILSDGYWGGALGALGYSGSLYADIADSGSLRDLLNTAFNTDGQWAHIVQRFNAGASDVWINGVSAGGADDLASTLADITGVQIGGAIGGTDFVGMIEHVGLWNRAITDAEIASLYNAGAGITLF